VKKDEKKRKKCLKKLADLKTRRIFAPQ